MVTVRRILLFLSVFTLSEYEGVISLGPLRSTPNKLFTGMLLAIALVGMAVEGRRFPANPKNWWIAAFTAAVAVGFGASVAAGLPASGLIPPLNQYLSVIFFYFVIVWVIPTHKDVRIVLWAVTLGTALVCASALIGVGRFHEGAQWTRASGFGGNPNRMGYMASATLPLVLALYNTVKARTSRILLIGCAVAILAGVIASLSRNAFVMVAVMCAYGMVRFGRLDLLRFAPLPVLVFVALLFLAPKQAYERAATMTSAEARAKDDSIQGRLRDYNYATRAFLSNPLTGVGFQRFGTWVHDNVDWTIQSGKAIHSAYFRIAADHGLVGLIPFFGLLGATWYDFRRSAWLARRFRRRRDPELGQLANYALFAETAFIGTLVGNIFCPSVAYKILWLLFALATTLLLLIRQRAAELLAEQPEAVVPAYGPLAPGPLPSGGVPAR